MTNSQAPTADDNDSIEPPKRQRKSAAGRKLMRWDPSYDQLVLLYIEYICVKKNISIPWDEVAAHLNDYTTGEGIKQHLAKVRTARDAYGQPIPPKIGGRKKIGSGVTESGPKKRMDISKRSGLLHYPDDRNFKHHSLNNETNGTMPKAANSTKSIGKPPKTGQTTDQVDVAQIQNVTMGSETLNDMKEINRGKKRNRGSALAKELQELTETHEGPLKKQMTTKLRAREPVDYSDMELQEEDQADKKHDSGLKAQPWLKFEDSRQNIRQPDWVNNVAADKSSSGYTEQVAHPQYSKHSRFRRPEGDSLQPDTTVAVAELSPFSGTSPRSGRPHMSPSNLSKYDNAPSAYQSGGSSVGHIQNERTVFPGSSLSFSNSELRKPPAYGSRMVSTYRDINRISSDHGEEAGISRQIVYANDPNRSESPQIVKNISTGQIKVTHRPQSMFLNSLVSPAASISVAQMSVLEHGPLPSGWADEPLNAVFRPKFPTSCMPLDPRSELPVNPFNVHVDPYQACSSYAYIMNQQENGVMPMKGESPGVSTGHPTDTELAYGPANTDLSRYEKRMQRWQGLKADVANYNDTFHANIAPSQVLPSSHSYHKEDQDLLGFKIRDIQPTNDMEESADVVDHSHEMFNHDDGAALAGDSAERSDSEADVNIFDSDMFDQFVNFKTEQSDSDPDLKMLDDQSDRLLEPSADEETYHVMKSFY